MSNRRVFRLCVWACVAVYIVLTAAHTPVARAARAAKPSIVFIFVDDMGYGDLGCYGHPTAKTPVIDRLAEQGVRFTAHYSNGTECSPSRTAFYTGAYQQRAGGLECAIGTGNVGRYDDAIRLANQHDLGLPADASVIPRCLNDAGYVCGLIGKWHLGYEPKFNPMEHGWAEFFGYTGGNVDYFTHRETSDLHVLFEGRKPVDREGYMTHLITDASIAFINKHKAEPFFLMLSHECPHFPYQGPGDAKKVVTPETWTSKDPAAYVAMLEDIDAEVGRLLDAIDAAGIADDTLVVFASDNGGVGGAAYMSPLRGHKSTTLEGGIRVPMIIRWPGRITPGQVCDQPCLTFDLTRSFLRIAGATVPDDHPLDGYDIIDHVQTGRPTFARQMFWRGRRGDVTWCAARDGDLKYVRQSAGSAVGQWLYDVARDPGEQHDLQASKPAEFARLKKLLMQWESRVKATR